MNIARLLRPKIYKSEMKLINLNEDELVKKILDGELVFDKGYANRYVKIGYISKGGVFKIYTLRYPSFLRVPATSTENKVFQAEYSPFSLTTSYFVVNGIDRNYEIRDGKKCWTNYTKLYHAISNKMGL
jgi:hypothetical protein